MSIDAPQDRSPARDANGARIPAAAGAEQHLNPCRRIEAVFSRIAATRMAGVPACNPVLEVEMVCVRRWQDEWLGVLITPWAINLVLLPGGGGTFRALWPGDTQWWQFPSGAFEFLGNRERGLGAYQVHALYAPALEFTSQDAARHAARRAIDALFEPGVGATAASMLPQAEAE